MARDMTTTAADISMGSDASVDDFADRSVLIWMNHNNVAGADRDLMRKGDPSILGVGNGWTLRVERGLAADTGHLSYVSGRATANGEWVTPNNSLSVDDLHHVAIVYDDASTGNNPDMYVDGDLEIEAETSVPLGAENSDAAENLLIGQPTGGNSYVGVAAFFVYDDTLFTASDVNRHRWWGRAPGGPSSVEVWHPFWTSETNNKGVATADATPSAEATMTDIPRVKRRTRRGRR